MTQGNRLFSELAVGDAASITRVVTPDDLYVFARVSGNLNPTNLPSTAGDDGVAAAPAMWIGSCSPRCWAICCPAREPSTRHRPCGFMPAPDRGYADGFGDRAAIAAAGTVVLATKVERAAN